MSIRLMDQGEPHKNEEAKFVDFEIVHGPEPAGRPVSPWPAVRLVMMSVIGLVSVIVFLMMGVLLLIPLLIFIAITRTISALLSAGPNR